MKIYVASSWRNHLQPAIVLALRRCGHEVYDFKHPAPDNKGFAWSDIDPSWQKWTPEEYRAALQHPIAVAGYKLDIEALKACDACVLVLPSGRSASWEFGFAMGQGKRGFVYQQAEIEPELMYREAQILTKMDELFDVFGEPGETEGAPPAGGGGWHQNPDPTGPAWIRWASKGAHPSTAKMPLRDRALSLAEDLAAWAAEHPDAGDVLVGLGRAWVLLREAAEVRPRLSARLDDLRAQLEREVLDPGAVRQAFNELEREVSHG